MVSADALNLDVLELTFAHLDQHDLFHLCLVSQKFLAAATPILYRSIGLKPTPRRASAFDTILLYPALAGHVRHIRITLPILSSEQVQICRTILGLRTNTSLDSFVCTPFEVKTFVDILPTLASIGYLRANVQLLKEGEQPSLLQVRGLRSITLEFASWKLTNVLPTWAADTLSSTLKNLTLYSCSGLTGDIIRATVAHLPNLTGLHISTCKGFDFPDVFSVIPHVASLNALSFSIWDLTRARENFQPLSLPNLKELVVDLLRAVKPFPLNSFLSIFALFKDAPLTSLAICGRSQIIPPLPLASYELLINQHAQTLHRVVLVKANVPTSALHSICKACKQLEILGIPVPSAADLGNLSADLKFELRFEKRRGSGFTGRWYMPPETL
ncbi:hypothetical protein BDM02DRAFT_3189629 [Thelephora ganbajun]|uniref:Uncharacterized protein n=1 Tax=Thelephora ganbajun TaxID=370292 RepID=A0ACB6Z7M9_THEGA|nr:hypothetical protein BDM02DRAFT_3189629 [Thelephora ganbajun]